jgi:hypothetical protein
MMITLWFTRLDHAKSSAELITVVKDFMATWTPAELALLPEKCRPSSINDEQYVECLRSTLVEEYRVTDATGNELELLQRLTSFFLRASIRLSELSPPTSGGLEPTPSGPARSLAPPEN